MTPAIFQLNIRDSRIGDAEPCRQIQLGNMATHFSNDQNVVGCQLGLPLPFTHGKKTCLDRVADILRSCDPLQVPWSIITSVAVPVIDLMEWRRRWAKERLSDQPTNEMGTAASVTIQLNRLVTTRDSYPSQCADMADLGNWKVPDAANTAKIGDFVPVFMADNGSPLFGGVIMGMHRKLTPFGAMRSDAPRHRDRLIIPQVSGVWI